MSVYQRGNRWWFRQVRDGKVVRRSLGPSVRTKEQALAAIGEGDVVLGTPMLTLRDYFKQYLAEARIRLSENSLERYEYSFRALMRHFGDHMLLANLTTLHLNQWAGTLLDKGRSPDGVNLDLRHIRAALRRAEDLGVLAIAPKVDMVRTAKRLPRHLTQEQVELIIKAEANDTYKRLWAFLMWTGLRRAEALGLDWSHVDLTDQPVMTVIGKGDRERVVPIVPPALEAMGAPLKVGPVFLVGGDRQVTARFKEAARRAGLPKARLHDLRHTCLTLLVGHGVPLKLVQDIAGHSSINTTMRYAKIFTGNAHAVLKDAFGF